MLHKYLLPLQEAFEQEADKKEAVKAKAYLLNQFEHYGIKTPVRRTLSKTYFKENIISDIKELSNITKSCFESPYREFHHVGIEFYAFHKKYWNKESISTIEYGLLHQSWWDTVDTIASDWIHPYFLLFPEQVKLVTQRWNKSSNIWLQRSSIMFQKFRKKETDTTLLTSYIENCCTSKEFFIQKAIGWALREYGKTNPRWVREFVDNHELTPLSKREALKNL